MKNNFRVWNEANKQWIVSPIALLNSGSFLVLVDDKWIEKNNGLTAQFGIDFKDINGKEVFDGDVVKYRRPATPIDQDPEWIILVIEYVDVVASYRAVRDFDGEHPIHEDVKIEIIGNIKDNPELKWLYET